MLSRAPLRQINLTVWNASQASSWSSREMDPLWVRCAAPFDKRIITKITVKVDFPEPGPLVMKTLAKSVDIMARTLCAC